MGLYPTKQGLKALKEALEKRYMKKIPTEDLVKMAEFTLNNNIFDFNIKAYQQKSCTATGTKFAPPYACIYMEEVEHLNLWKRKQKTAYLVKIRRWYLFHLDQW